MRALLLILTAALLSVNPAAAVTNVNQTVPVSGEAEVSIEILAGTLTVTGWSGNEVLIEGTLGNDVRELEVESEGNEVYIEGDLGRMHEISGDDDIEINLQVKVPFGASVDIEGVALDIEVHGVTGSVEIETVSGNIDVTGNPAEIQASTVSGNLTIGGSSSEIDAETASGNISVSDLEGEINASTVSGNMTIKASRLVDGSLETVNGDIRFEGGLGTDGDLDIQSVSGNVYLFLPAGISASFDLSSFSGNITTDMGDMTVKTARYVKSREASFTIGGGDFSVSVETFSGNCEIKRM